MEIGLGLDPTLGLSFAEQETVSREAAALGYESLWTPEGTGHDAFQICTLRWRASAEVVPGGLVTGVAVSPVGYRSPVAFAVGAGTASAVTGGKFILGIGSGGIYRKATRDALGFRGSSTLTAMREYVTTVKALLRGETVSYDGQSVTLRGAQLAISPPPQTPVYLGALGPEMLRLGGEIADGVALNWCNPAAVQSSRERLQEGQARSGRSDVPKMAEYIRICVDDDAAVARKAYVRNLLGYALGMTIPSEGEKRLGYRAHFIRMGFGEELDELDRRRRAGARMDELVEAVSEDLALGVGYYGPASGAAEAFARLAEGLDTAIVRVVAARPGIGATRAVMEACRPGLVLSPES